MFTRRRELVTRVAAVGGLVAAVVAGVLASAAPVGAADTTPPTQPGSITVSSLTSTSVKLSWGASTDNVGIEGYRIFRSGHGAASTQIHTNDSTVRTYSATHLYASTTYTVGVVAIDAAGNSSPMTTVSFTTAARADSTAPSAPGSSSVVVSAFSSSRIDVQWGASASTDVASYQVLRDGAVVATVDLPLPTRYSDNGLAESTSHTYVIKAIDSSGNVSAGTSGKTATTLTAGTVRIARGPYVSAVTATSAVVSWWTNLATTGTVGYGLASPTEQTVTDPAGSLQHHQVTITGLAGNSTYRYTVTSGTVSAGGSFPTAAAPGTAFTFAAIGDFGGNSAGEKQNAANINTAATSFIQTAGDNIYPSAGLPDPDFASTYSDFDGRFFKQFGTTLRTQPFFPANGNQEYYGNGAFWQAFPFHSGSTGWYSYDWGDAHILVLDTEQPIATGTPQYSFASSDLAAHQSATWRIAVFQRPPYSSTSAVSSSKPVLQYLVPLMDQYHVNLVLSGNSHNYERSKPLYGGAVVTTGGTTYVVTGAGGNGFNKFTIAEPSWSAFREATYYEFVEVSVSPTTLAVQAIRADTDTVADSATIVH